MIQTEVTRFYTFEAAHSLPCVEGRAARLHGHTYTVGVTMRSEDGSIVPTEALDVMWQSGLMSLLDHRNLDDTIGKDAGTTSVEDIAKYLLRRMSDLPVVEVTVQEGAMRRGVARYVR